MVAVLRGVRRGAAVRILDASIRHVLATSSCSPPPADVDRPRGLAADSPSGARRPDLRRRAVTARSSSARGRRPVQLATGERARLLSASRACARGAMRRLAVHRGPRVRRGDDAGPRSGCPRRPGVRLPASSQRSWWWRGRGELQPPTRRTTRSPSTGCCAARRSASVSAPLGPAWRRSPRPADVVQPAGQPARQHGARRQLEAAGQPCRGRRLGRVGLAHALPGAARARAARGGRPPRLRVDHGRASGRQADAARPGRAGLVEGASAASTTTSARWPRPTARAQPTVAKPGRRPRRRYRLALDRRLQSAGDGVQRGLAGDVRGHRRSSRVPAGDGVVAAHTPASRVRLEHRVAARVAEALVIERRPCSSTSTRPASRRRDRRGELGRGARSRSGGSRPRSAGPRECFSATVRSSRAPSRWPVGERSRL